MWETVDEIQDPTLPEQCLEWQVTECPEMSEIIHPAVHLNSGSRHSMRHCPAKANVCTSIPDNNCLLSRFLVIGNIYKYMFSG